MMERIKKDRRGGEKWKQKACMAAAIFCVSICTGTRVGAYEEITQIDVTVGYWGMEVYTKGTATLEELAENCGTHREIYTWIDNKPAAGTTEAEGVYLNDIMDYFGINTDSVYYYNFYTLDASSYEGAWENWSSDALLRDRYTLKECFQNALDAFNAAGLEEFNANPENYYKLTDFYNCADNKDDASYFPDAWQKRLAVPPMLALSKNAVRWESRYPCAFLDYADMTSYNMPQLLYGQNAVNDVGRSNMAKMVTKIHVWFEGYPEITGDLSDLEGEVGSSAHVNINVNTPDDYLTQMIEENIKWTSNDENVATVDEDGNVTFVGEGTASISASYIYQDANGNEKEVVGYTTGITSKAGTGDDDADSGPEENQQDDENSRGAGDSKIGNGVGDEAKDSKPEKKQQDHEKIRGTGNSKTGSSVGDGAGNSTAGGGDSGGYSRSGDGAGSGTDDGNNTNHSEQYYLADHTGEAAQTKKKETNKADAGDGQADNQLQVALAGVDSGGRNLKVYEIKETLKELPEIEDNTSMKTAGVLAAALLAAGISGEGIYFRRQKKKG